MVGRVASAMANSSWRCWPCDMAAATRFAAGASPTSARRLRAGSRSFAICAAGRQNRKLCGSVACTASATFSSEVKVGKMLVIWNDRASPSRARSAVDSDVMSRPAKRIVPASGVISPVN